MKIGCGTVLFRKFDLERSLEAIRGIGYEYFETQAVGPWCPHVNIETDDPENLVKLKNKFGFKGITGLWSYNGNIIRPENSVETVSRSIEWAAAAGIPVVHFGDGSKVKGTTDEEAFETLQEKLTKILAVAKKYGVRMALEPHGAFSLTGEGLKRILSIGTPDVLGINYDGCNIFRSGYVESGDGKSGYVRGENGADEVAILHEIGDRVIHCHAKDVNDKMECVAVGDGRVNVRGVVEYLKAIGYDGVVSVETEGGDDFDSVVELAAKSYRYLDRIING